MKSRMSFNLLVGAVVLACIASTGCRKKNVPVTPLPHATVHQANQSQLSDANPFPPQANVNSQPAELPPVTSLNTADRSTWKRNTDQFKTEAIYFDYDSAAIKDSEKSKLETVTAYYKSNTSPNVALKIEGNCDERGTEEYNRGLGLRRAQAVREYLIHSGVAGDRIDVESFGEDKPVASGHNEAAWKQNRRDDFVVLTAP